jgi:glycine cleavage system aminomethyltransferase T
MAFERSELKNHYGDPIGEARSCRKGSALFDFSFLECLRLQGPAALSFVEAFVRRPLATLMQGAIAYAIRTDSYGTALADLTVWRTGTDTFEVMSGRREDVWALMAGAPAQVEATDLGAARVVFAVQGPGALDALHELGRLETVPDLTYFRFAEAELAGVHCTVGRLGYTGEAGFEIILPRSESSRVWRELARHSRPAGFIAMDALRIEAGFVLFANELRLPVSPAELELQQFHTDRNPRATGLKLVSFQAKADHLSLPWIGNCSPQRPLEPGIIAITSACNSTVAGGILGLGFVTASTPDDAPLHDPSGEFREIRRAPRPFYDALKRRPRQPWR